MPIVKPGNERDEYLELVQKFPLTRIKNKTQLKDALKMVDKLLKFEERLTKGGRDYFEALLHFVDAYEKEHCEIDPPEDHEVLGHLIDAKGVSRAELARQTGIQESTLCAIIKGDRKLNRGHIAELCKYFNVRPTVFRFSSDSQN